MQISILYDSRTGNTAKMAEYIIEGIKTVENVDAKAFSIDELDEKYVNESQAIIIGTPTYNGYLTGKMKLWLEEKLGKLNVAGKIGGAYATAAYIHGCGDLAIQCILTHMMVDGMLTYSGGHVFGAPVIHLGPVAISPDTEKFAEIFRIYGSRMAQQVKKLLA